MFEFIMFPVAESLVPLRPLATSSISCMFYYQSMYVAPQFSIGNSQFLYPLYLFKKKRGEKKAFAVIVGKCRN